MWISLNIKLNVIDEKIREQKLKELNLDKPKSIPPSIDKDAKKDIGITKTSLKNEALNIFKNKSYLYFTNANKISYYLRDIANKTSSMSHIHNSFNKDDARRFYNNQLKYIQYFNSHKKIIQYKEYHKKYYDMKEEIAKEICFSKSKYNRAGMLVQLKDFKTNEIHSFLIGSKSNITAYFHPSSHVFRCKELLSNNDIVADLIFQ